MPQSLKHDSTDNVRAKPTKMPNARPYATSGEQGLDVASAVIECSNFSFSIDTQPILRDISFTVGRGELICLVGPNGAGKSTLIKCLMRIWSGRHDGIAINGIPINQIPQDELAKQLAYVPQSGGAAPPFTAYEYVMMARYPYLTPFSGTTPADETAVQDAMKRTGCNDFQSRTLDTLSGGEAQKVHLAAALAQQTPTLLLDEPTTFLDPHHQIEITQTLVRLNQEQDTTILCATHDLNTALSIAHRIIALRDGSIVFDGPAHELANTETLRTVYAHDFVISEHPRTGHAIVLPDSPTFESPRHA